MQFVYILHELYNDWLVSWQDWQNVHLEISSQTSVPTLSFFQNFREMLQDWNISLYDARLDQVALCFDWHAPAYVVSCMNNDFFTATTDHLTCWARIASVLYGGRLNISAHIRS